MAPLLMDIINDVSTKSFHIFISRFYLFSPWNLDLPLNLPLNLLLSRLSITFLLQDLMNVFFFLKYFLFLASTKVFSSHYSPPPHPPPLILNQILNWYPQDLGLGLLLISFSVLLLSNLFDSKEFQCHLYGDDSTILFSLHRHLLNYLFFYNCISHRQLPLIKPLKLLTFFCFSLLFSCSFQ